MTLSLTSILTTIFYSSILIISISLFLNSKKLITQVEISSLFFCIIIIIVRSLIPFELPFTKNLPFRHILPDVVMFFKRTVITIGNYNISFYHISALFWTLGSVISLIRSIHSHQYFKRLINNLPNEADIQIENTLQKVLERYNKSKSFKIIQTSEISTPMIFGV